MNVRTQVIQVRLGPSINTYVLTLLYGTHEVLIKYGKIYNNIMWIYFMECVFATM